MKQKHACFFLFHLLFLSAIAKSQNLSYIFKAGDLGYACFRIPAIIKTNTGTLLAFAEARKNGCGDAGNIDLVLRRSADGGQSWSALQVVWNDENNTCGNPAPVVDLQTGNIFLLSTWNLGTDHEPMIIDQTSKNTRRVFVLRSTDDGRSWPVKKLVWEGPSAYSNLVQLSSGSIGCLFEGGIRSAYEGIAYISIDCCDTPSGQEHLLFSDRRSLKKH